MRISVKALFTMSHILWTLHNNLARKTPQPLIPVDFDVNDENDEER
jgi:hypothetical protein